MKYNEKIFSNYKKKIDIGDTIIFTRTFEICTVGVERDLPVHTIYINNQIKHVDLYHLQGRKQLLDLLEQYMHSRLTKRENLFKLNLRRKEILFQQKLTKTVPVNHGNFPNKTTLSKAFRFLNLSLVKTLKFCGEP